MRAQSLLSFLFLVLATGATGAADDFGTGDPLLRDPQWIFGQSKRPEVDTKNSVKASLSFLREREPELTPEEYAIYEKIAGLLSTSPELGVTMLEGMMNEKERPSPAFEFALGNAYYSANRMDEATKYYRSAIDRYPDFLRAWKNLGMVHYAKSDFAEAVKCLSKAMILGDKEPTTAGLLGYCLEMQGDLLAAETAYLQALSSDPANPDWQRGLLGIYVRERQFGRAESLIRRMIKATPTDAHLWLDYAGILISDHRALEAMAVLESAQAAGVAGPDELLLLGDLYAQQGLATEAAAVYAKVLGADRSRGEQKLVYFAQVLIAAGKVPEAEQTLAAIKGAPTAEGRIALLQTRADLLMAKQRWSEARKEIEALLAIAPLNGRALLSLGRTYAKEDDLPRAGFAFEAAARLPEAAYQANLELGNIEVKNRHFAKAVAYLEKALQLKKSDEIEDYLVRLRALVPSDAHSG